jgi:hypothetical protein
MDPQSRADRVPLRVCDTSTGKDIYNSNSYTAMSLSSEHASSSSAPRFTNKQPILSCMASSFWHSRLPCACCSRPPIHQEMFGNCCNDTNVCRQTCNTGTSQTTRFRTFTVSSSTATTARGCTRGAVVRRALSVSATNAGFTTVFPDIKPLPTPVAQLLCCWVLCWGVRFNTP